MSKQVYHVDYSKHHWSTANPFPATGSPIYELEKAGVLVFVEEPTTNDRPATAAKAKKLMLDWAEGKRSWMNLGPYKAYTADVIAAMDAQEVVKWGAVYRALKGRGDE